MRRRVDWNAGRRSPLIICKRQRAALTPTVSCLRLQNLWKTANLWASWGSDPQLFGIAITFARRQGHDWDEESRPRRGGTGVCRDRDLLLGKSGPSLLPWWDGLSHKVVSTIDGAALGAAPFFELGSAPGLPAGKLAWCWPQPHTSPGLGPSPHRIAYRDGSTVRLFAAHKRPLRVPDH